MNILHLDLGHEMRGGQWQVFYLTRFLAAQSAYTPVVACPNHSPLAARLRAAGITVIGLSGGCNPLSLARLLYAGRKRKFALIHTHDARGARLGALLRKLWGRRVKLVHTRRVSYPVKKRSLGKYRLADAVVGVSRDTVLSLIRGGLPAEKLSAIHSGIELSRYTRRCPRDDGRFIFGMVGAFTPQKGHSVLLQALARLTEQACLRDGLPPWEVRLVGDGPLFNTVLAEAQTLGVAGRLAMLGRQDAAEILPGCDALLAPSVDGEGSSGVIKEAWAVGLPLICSDLAANLELVENGRNALTFACGQAEDLARAMRRLALNPDLCRQLVAAGYSAVQDYTAEKMALAYVDLYARLLGKEKA